MKMWDIGRYCICKGEVSKRECKMTASMKMFATLEDLLKLTDEDDIVPSSVETRTDGDIEVTWEDYPDCYMYYILLYDSMRERVYVQEMVTLSSNNSHIIKTFGVLDIGYVKVLRLFPQTQQNDDHGLIEIFKARGLYEMLIIQDRCLANAKNREDNKSKYDVYFGFLQRKHSKPTPPMRVALKCFPTDSDDQGEFVRDILDRASEAGGKYNSKYLASTDISVGDGKVLIAMEFYAGQTLLDLTSKSCKYYSAMEKQIKICFTDIMLGLIHIHDKEIVHGEMIRKNILLSSDFSCLKIGNYVETAMAEYAERNQRGHRNLKVYRDDLKDTAEMFRECLNSCCQLNVPEMENAHTTFDDWFGPKNTTSDADIDNIDANLGKYLVWFMYYEENVTAKEVLQHPYFWSVHQLIYFVYRMDACFYENTDNIKSIKDNFNNYFKDLNWYAKFERNLTRHRDPKKTVDECTGILMLAGRARTIIEKEAQNIEKEATKLDGPLVGHGDHDTLSEIKSQEVLETVDKAQKSIVYAVVKMKKDIDIIEETGVATSAIGKSSEILECIITTLRNAKGKFDEAISRIVQTAEKNIAKRVKKMNVATSEAFSKMRPRPTSPNSIYLNDLYEIIDGQFKKMFNAFKGGKNAVMDSGSTEQNTAVDSQNEETEDLRQRLGKMQFEKLNSGTKGKKTFKDVIAIAEKIGKAIDEANRTITHENSEIILGDTMEALKTLQEKIDTIKRDVIKDFETIVKEVKTAQNNIRTKFTEDDIAEGLRTVMQFDRGIQAISAHFQTVRDAFQGERNSIRDSLDTELTTTIDRAGTMHFKKLKKDIKKGKEKLNAIIVEAERSREVMEEGKVTIEREILNFKSGILQFIDKEVEGIKKEVDLTKDDIEKRIGEHVEEVTPVISRLKQRILEVVRKMKNAVIDARACEDMKLNAERNKKAIDEIMSHYIKDEGQIISNKQKEEMTSFLRCIRNTHAHYHDKKNRYFESTEDLWRFFVKMYPNMICVLHRLVWENRNKLPDDIKGFFLTPTSAANLDFKNKQRIVAQTLRHSCVLSIPIKPLT